MKYFFIVFFLSCFSVFAQNTSLSYYLPDEAYDVNIPTPESVFGFQVGDRHLTSELIRFYLEDLAKKSGRIELEYYAESHEQNPLILLTITSQKNHSNLEQIRKDHLKLTDHSSSNKVDIENMPAIVYQAYSVHGNEASGANGSVIWAYYLAASQTEQTKELLDETIILVDPYLNPDGLNRFTSWVNLNRSENNSPDKQERGHYAAWPNGRTNHYLFDMNRDYITTEHPESKGRIKLFHKWKPNVYSDHHEMGSSKTYFFQPGAPQRVNSFTPKENQDITAKIGQFHADALNKISSLYYSGEGYDDFFYGKGSTYPDINGSVGILFEQARTSGPIIESPNGNITFPFTIKNQIQTSFSTLKGVKKYRKELLEYQRQFFKTSYDEAKKDPDRAFVFQDKYDKGKLKLFIDLLHRHKIDIYRLKTNAKVDGIDFTPESAFVIPLEQKQYKLIKSSFKKITSFQDSVFYDISAWTLPLAYNMEYGALKNKFSKHSLGEKITDTENFIKLKTPPKSQYAYLFKWDDYYAPKALAVFQQAGILTKVSTSQFTLEGENYEEGTILIPLQNQNKEVIYKLVLKAQQQSNIQLYSVSTGLTSKGVDLGSPDFKSLINPKTALIVGKGVSSYDAGEVWYLFDKIYDMPIVKLDLMELQSYNLNIYNTIVMTDGSYASMTPAAIEKIKYCVNNGTTLIVTQKAINWAKKNGLSHVVLKKIKKDHKKEFKYSDHSPEFSSKQIKGTIFETYLDITHPIGFGYKNKKLPIFRSGNIFLNPTKNVFATPLKYVSNPLLSGYVKKENYDSIKNSASIVISKFGKGKVISFADNPTFRMSWKGTTKLFANAVFFGKIIDSRTLEIKIDKTKN